MLFLIEPPKAIYHNVMQKNWSTNWARSIEQMQAYRRAGSPPRRTRAYTTNDAAGVDWQLMLGGSAERMGSWLTIPIGLSVYSPPFAKSLYTYSNSRRDLGNNRTVCQFFSSTISTLSLKFCA